MPNRIDVVNQLIAAYTDYERSLGVADPNMAARALVDGCKPANSDLRQKLAWDLALAEISNSL